MRTSALLPLALAALVLLGASRCLADSKAVPEKSIDDGVHFLSLAGSPDGSALLAVGEHGRIVRRTSEEPSWSLVAGSHPTGRAASVPTDVLLTCVSFADEDHVWAGGHDATLVKSSDGGRTWSFGFSDPDAEAPFLDLWFEDREHGLAIGAYGLVYETFDGGGSWEDREIAPEGPHLYSITESPAGSLYVAGEFGTVLRSGDRGESWTELTTPYSGTFFGALALSDESVLVYGLRGNLYRTEDAGTTWDQVEIGTSASLLTGLEEERAVLLAGLAGAVLRSSDSGEQFAEENRPDRIAITDLVRWNGALWVSSDQGLTTLSGAPAAKDGTP